MASMRDIKRRKGSIQSTQQITKAMKLVATVKLQRSKKRAESTKPYFEYMYATVHSLLAASPDLNNDFIKGNSSKNKAVIVITSNRGLAGGYNTNVTKLITAGELEKSACRIYAVGHKGKEILKRRDYKIEKDYSDIMNEPLFSDAAKISKDVLDKYEKGEAGEIYLAYTAFKNTVIHEPKLIKLLPVEPDYELKKDADKLTLMNFEPSEEEALSMIIPKYITSLIYGAIIEGVASENGARMQAMDSATNNAEEMISDLTLKYNRARQSSITQEITEIIAGAQAIG